MTTIQLEILQQKSIEVLESLKSTFPEKNGVANGWKFEMAYSILHKVRKRSLFSSASQRISALKAQCTVTSTLSRRLHIVP
jgi:hypothetical protein